MVALWDAARMKNWTVAQKTFFFTKKGGGSARMGLISTCSLFCLLRFAQTSANLLAQRNLTRRAAAARQPTLQEVDADLVDGRGLPNFHL